MVPDEDLLLVALLLLAAGVSDPDAGRPGPEADGGSPAPAGAEAGAAANVDPDVAPVRPVEVAASRAEHAGDPLYGVDSRGRYQVIRPSLSAEGRVTRVSVMPDGKVRILMRPDPKYMRLIGERNVDLVGGNLVVTVVPVDRGSVPVPPVGARVRVTGAYVLDTTHGWRAIEPVRQIELAH